MTTLPPQIQAIQPDCFNKLLSEPTLSKVAIFMIEDKDITSQVNSALGNSGAGRNGGCGATIEVLETTLASDLPNAPGPVLVATQKFIVKERPLFNFSANGTQLKAKVIAQFIIQAIHQLSLGGLAQAFYPGSPCFKAVDAGPGANFAMREVNMNATLPLTPLQQCGNAAPPVEAPALTLAFTAPASDPTASIYYTTDGSFPGPGNTGTTVDGQSYGPAVLYTGPFTVEAGTIVRWACYVAGKVGSSTGMATINS